MATASGNTGVVASLHKKPHHRPVMNSCSAVAMKAIGEKLGQFGFHYAGSKHSSCPATSEDDESRQGHHHGDGCDCETGKLSNLKTCIGDNTKERPFKCHLCPQSFSRRSLLIRHLRVHSGEKPFQCASCSLSFSQKAHLDRHLLVHTGERPFRCHLCPRSFSQNSLLKDHLRVHTGEQLDQCHLCLRSFSRRSNLSVHLRMHSGERPYYCTICSKSFVVASHLKRHMKTKHQDNPECNGGYRHQSSPTTTEDKSQQRLLHPCGFCDIETGRLFCLKTRMKVQTGEESFQCLSCPQTFVRSSYLKRHLHMYTGSKHSSCLTTTEDDVFQQGQFQHGDSCDGETGKLSNLKTHIGDHTKERPFQCHLCPQSFSHRSSLIRHLRIHSGEKPFQCPSCSLSFSQKAHLDTHLRVHTGERPFRCHLCLQSFSHRSNLNTHLRIHSGERPYCCTICSKSFALATHLKRHVKTKHHDSTEKTSSLPSNSQEAAVAGEGPQLSRWL
ncbi:uncharacterized protein [Dermacentor andersoni]|uniref:uncharacterized protein n=1 Tax=Dermacentor andersoni TaxID=34620 RepID=UPI003B3B5058